MPLTQSQGGEGPAAPQQHRPHKQRRSNSAAGDHRAGAGDVPLLLPLVLQPDSPTSPSEARAAAAGAKGPGQGVGGVGASGLAAAALVLGGGSQADPICIDDSD
jgi:hypothetical protein